MPRLTILTAAYAPSAHHLPETAASVQAQELPPGWDLEWVIQEDGDVPTLGPSLEVNPLIRYEANGKQLGIGSTRNMALSRATGDLVQILDHDDVLLPGALALMVSRFEEHPIHWAVGAADDLLEDGTRKSWDSALPFGTIAAGQVNRWAEEHMGNWPVHCAGLMMRTNSLRSCGGWAGAPVDDDIVMFAALSELGAGWNEQTVTWLYRQHPLQTHRSDEWSSLSYTGRRMAMQRVKALRHAGVTLVPEAAIGFGADSTTVDIGRSIKDPEPNSTASTSQQ
jgi:glycosyltransferase involved in cell wall biosynthesis